VTCCPSARVPELASPFSLADSHDHHFERRRNGRSGDTSLEALLVHPGTSAARPGDRHEREVVPRGRWTEQRVSEGDVVELLAATQGG